jgi:cardiolipin synthase
MQSWPSEPKRLVRFAWILFVLAALAACASLPSVGRLPDHRKPVQVVGPSGVLSHERSQAVVGTLETDEPGAAFFKRHLEVEQAVSEAPLLIGNATRLLADGPSTYSAMLHAIANARLYIHMESYIFDDDWVGEEFAQALIDAHKRGVEVALMVDSFGALGESQPMFNRMRDNGIKLVFFNPINPFESKVAWSPDQRNHRKLMVVDGREGFLGGINISSVYESAPAGAFGSGPSNGGSGGPSHAAKTPDEAPWRDTHLQVNGPAVAQIDRVFMAAWKQQLGAPIAERTWLGETSVQGDSIVRIIASDPRKKNGFTIYLTLMSALQSAQHSIHITMAYFIPNAAFVQALADAAKRGVDVTLVLPGFTDSSLVLDAGQANYDVLLRAGVKLYERRDALLHAKTVVIDGVWSTVGSSNMDWRSFTLNYEINAVVLGPAFGAQMEALFAEDVKAAVRIDPRIWAQRGLPVRFMDSFSSLFEHWM